jgi:Tol biopolymer transport system component
MLSGTGVNIFGGGVTVVRYDVAAARSHRIDVIASEETMWSVTGLAVTDDGSAIVLASGEAGEFPPRNLVLARGDGSGVRQLTTGQYWETSPSWLPDGSAVVFQSDRCCATSSETGTYQLYAVEATGGDPRRITNGDEDDLLPAVSPDGTRVAFIRQVRQSAQASLWLVTLDGTEERRVLDFSERFPTALAWAPSGRDVFVASAGVNDATPDIVRIAVDDAQPQPRTVYRCARACGLGAGGIAASPDGRWLAVAVAVTDQTQPSTVVIVDLASGETRRLPGTRADGVCCLAWQPAPPQ